MILTAHQPAYLPWLGYFAKVASADRFVLHDVSRYDRGGMLNRNKIRTATGELMLTVPVSREDLRGERLLDAIRPIEDGWQRRHWKAIQLAYRRAPYFVVHADFLDHYYRESYPSLAALCEPFIDYCAEQLSLPVKAAKTSELDLPPFDRNSIIPLLCERFGARTFVAGPMVVDYLDWDQVRRAGVDVEVFEYQHPTYPQLHPGFLSHLSVLDLLMNCGPRSADILRTIGCPREFRGAGPTGWIPTPRPERLPRKR